MKLSFLTVVLFFVFPCCWEVSSLLSEWEDDKTCV